MLSRNNFSLRQAPSDQNSSRTYVMTKYELEQNGEYPIKCLLINTLSTKRSSRYNCDKFQHPFFSGSNSPHPIKMRPEETLTVGASLFVRTFMSLLLTSKSFQAALVVPSKPRHCRR